MISQIIQIYSYLIIARILLSWFPVSRGGPMEQISSLLYQVTEPVLGPVRRAIPPFGMFDVSAFVVIFGLQVLSRALT